MKRRTALTAILVLATAGSLAAATITVTMPTETNLWGNCISNAELIKWTQSGTLPATVKITLLNAASMAEVAVIAASAPNTGTYQDWTIPATLPYGKYVVRVKAVGAAVHGDSQAFTIKSCPSLVFISPFHMTSWSETTTQWITWEEHNGYLPWISLYLQNDKGQQVATIAEHFPNKHQLSWPIPGNLPFGKYRILLKSATTSDQALSEFFTITLSLKPALVPVKK